MSIQTIKNKVIDKVSDVMSYPARRNAQKSMIPKVTPSNFPTNSKKNKDGEIINPTKSDVSRFNSIFSTTTPKTQQMKALQKTMPLNAPKTMPAKKPQMSQRDMYSQAMNRAVKKGGSNGVKVGP